MKKHEFRQQYCGLELQGAEQRTSRTTGRREWWLSFYCNCGNMFAITLSVANQAHAKQRSLRCKDCKQAAKWKRPAIRPENETRTYSGDSLPPIPPGTLQLLKQYKKTPLYQKILQITARTVKAQASAGIVPEWKRIVEEAIGLAEMEFRSVELSDGWTSQTRAQGLQIQSYDLSRYAPAI